MTIQLSYYERQAEPKPIALGYMAGDHLLLEFEVTDQDGNAANLAGATPRFAVALDAGSAAVISTEADPPTAVATVTDAANGIFRVAIDGDDTDTLDGVYRWEAEIEDAVGEKTTVGRGTIVFAPNLI